MKPCGHPDHPEDGNVGFIEKGKPRVQNEAAVEAHRNDHAWFVGKHCKLGFPVNDEEKEYMWVLVTHVEGSELVGELQNTPLRVKGLLWGSIIGFTSDEIRDVMEAT